LFPASISSLGLTTLNIDQLELCEHDEEQWCSVSAAVDAGGSGGGGGGVCE
jgi:hypothetical protein